MQSDTIKLVSSHLVAVVMALGGPLLLTWLFLNASDVEGSQGLIALLAGFVGLAVQFLFQTNTQAAARATTRTDLLTTPEG